MPNPPATANIFKLKHLHAQRQNNLKYIPEDQQQEDVGDDADNGSEESSRKWKNNPRNFEEIEEIGSIESNSIQQSSMTPSHFNKLASLSSS